MIKPAPPKSRGIAGVLFVFFAAVASAGLLIDLLVLPHGGGGILAGSGRYAMFGAALALGAVLFAFALRWTLGRPITDQGETRARDHA